MPKPGGTLLAQHLDSRSRRRKTRAGKPRWKPRQQCLASTNSLPEVASNSSLADRIDVFEIEQFVAANLYELGTFIADGRRTAIDSLVKRYNEIVEEVET